MHSNPMMNCGMNFFNMVTPFRIFFIFNSKFYLGIIRKKYGRMGNPLKILQKKLGMGGNIRHGANLNFVLGLIALPETHL